jgi:3-phosphoshikimate 1-carboxyvinyltransferase
LQANCSVAELRGIVPIPGSKSHTIRGVLLASLSDGKSTLHRPLTSADTRAAISVYSQLGARFNQNGESWEIDGVGPDFKAPAMQLDVLNSGTTMRVAMGTCSLLSEGTATITGDAQIQSRPCGPLVRSLNDLGANVQSTNNGCAPFTISGRLQGGHTSIEAKTSQYVTSLLLACPLADGDTAVDVPLLYERPYVQMTLDWLNFMGVRVEHDNMRTFHIPGGQTFEPFERAVPADFSSAAFFLAAGALPGNRVTCTGLDLDDSQSDKAVVHFLREMGASVKVHGDAITVEAAQLKGIDIDMNDCPDSLPIMSVVGCFAEGTTRLLNVPQARIKETDRIAVMCRELSALGANIEELEDGLVVRRSSLSRAPVNGHHDHRVVMSLAIAATQIAGGLSISTAEAAAVTFPGFWDLLRGLGGAVDLLEVD